MTISLVVAAASNHAIGNAGTLPWHLPADLRHFKNITWGLPIIMGRKTYASLTGPLPGRTNIVLTRSVDWSPHNEAVTVVASAEEALQKARSIFAAEVMVIGGGEIYSLFLPMATKIYDPGGYNPRGRYLFSCPGARSVGASSAAEAGGRCQERLQLLL